MVQINENLLKIHSTDYSDYLKTMTDNEKKNWEENYEKVALSEEVRKLLKSPSRPINIIVFSGSWCGECAMAVPVLEKMVEESEFVTLYIIDREKSSELYKPFMPNGDKRVPVVLFTSEDFYVITQWIERCAKKFKIWYEICQEMKGKEKEEIWTRLSKEFREKNNLIRNSTIEEISVELFRAIGVVNFSSRLNTAF